MSCDVTGGLGSTLGLNIKSSCIPLIASLLLEKKKEPLFDYLFSSETLTRLYTLS